ncbi:MAG: hypothetical protein KDA32_01945 [Phycisphaerales bacterium]|nr:hypothetical protein [Phycisphaerales bacterium]
MGRGVDGLIQTPMTRNRESSDFVSRGGDKLAAALAAFEISVKGRVCADFGSHTGGFVDCLLRNGAARAYAVEPGVGVLHDRLRGDERVVVCEGENALSWTAPEPCDVISIDAGWTPQRLILVAAQRALAPGGCVISLIKPHYEADKRWLRRGVLPPERLEETLALTREDVTDLGWRIVDECASPLLGHSGNTEMLWLLRR